MHSQRPTSRWQHWVVYQLSPPSPVDVPAVFWRSKQNTRHTLLKECGRNQIFPNFWMSDAIIHLQPLSCLIGEQFPLSAEWQLCFIRALLILLLEASESCHTQERYAVGLKKKQKKNSSLPRFSWFFVMSFNFSCSICPSCSLNNVKVPGTIAEFKFTV